MIETEAPAADAIIFCLNIKNQSSPNLDRSQLGKQIVW